MKEEYTLAESWVWELKQRSGRPVGRHWRQVEAYMGDRATSVWHNKAWHKLQ
jgi:hypothetical protein